MYLSEKIICLEIRKGNDKVKVLKLVAPLFKRDPELGMLTFDAEALRDCLTSRLAVDGACPGGGQSPDQEGTQRTDCYHYEARECMVDWLEFIVYWEMSWN